MGLFCFLRRTNFVSNVAATSYLSTYFYLFKEFEQNSAHIVEAKIDSTLVCPVKMEYGPENNIFVLKMMMKSGVEKIILKFLHSQAVF